MTEPVFIDHRLSDYLEVAFHSKFKRTRNLHNDYWQLWSQSGLLEFVCQKMRSKYQTPILNEADDYQCIEKYVGDKSVSVDKFAFYDKWEHKETFRKELETVIYQLRLHRSAFSSLFDRIFYDIPIDPNEKWEGFDTEGIFSFMFPLNETIFLEGFTKREIVVIKDELIDALKRKLERDLTSKEDNQVYIWCQNLRRKDRAIKSVTQLALIIEQMKRYHSSATGLDDDDGNLTDGIKQTSERCATKVAAELPEDVYFDAATFRQTVRRLYKTFPILHEFISSQS